MPEKVCQSLIEKYRAEIKILLDATDELELRLNEENESDESAEEYVKIFKNYFYGESFTREMCLQLIDYVTVGERSEENGEREIHIYYKF